MARPELGAKRVCPTTGRKFYDLNRDPIVSPYTGEAMPRSIFDAPVVPLRGARAARPPADEDETEVVAAGPEIVSLEEVGAAEEEGAAAGDDETVLADESTTDDTFLEEEEEGGDVSDLIDSEIEDEEET